MAFGDRLRQGLQNLGSKLRDDKGLFQGGQYGQVGGRLRDWAESTRSPMGLGNTGQQDLSSFYGATPGENIFAGDEMVTPEFADARMQAATFDPSNPNEVRELQLRLIQQGLLPEGADDSMFVPQTEAALRQLQGQMPMQGGGLLDYTPQMQSGPSTIDRSARKTLDTLRSHMKDVY